MKLIALKASLALWQRRYATRLKMRAHARQALLEARDADLHPRQAILDRKILREQQTEEARRMVASLEQQIANADKGRVRRPFERVKMNVVCQSSRNGTRPTLIVLHDTEGANVPGIVDLEGLGAWFDRITTQASSHVGVDAEGNAAVFVADEAKAWAQASFNPRALSVEQIGHAAQPVWPELQLVTTAKYLAYWSKKYGIPLEHSTSLGVCQHSDLGAAGGGHVDCGPAYPFDHVLDLARNFKKTGW